ncbi:MAG: hypothetical protein ACYCPQ_03665 [Elusimicrobiota bacterium]
MPELSILTLSRLYLFFPRHGAKTARQENALTPSLWLYVLFLAASLAFYWLKPWNFPDLNAPFPVEPMGLWFWTKVMLWQPPLELAWIIFLLGLSSWLREGSFIFKLACGAAWTAAPFILIVLYAQNPQFSTWTFDLLLAAWVIPFYPLARKIASADWRPTLAFMLGTNVIGLAILLPMIISVIIDSKNFFYASQIIGGFWILIVSALGLKEILSLRLPRAFMAVLLSLFLQMALAFALHMAGLVPAQMLKALLYA